MIIGTKIYTWFYGQFVGRDDFGNKYYCNSKTIGTTKSRLRGIQYAKGMYIKFFDESTDASFSGTSYTGGSIMEYCIVEYAEYGLDISNASPFINYSEIRYNGKTGSSYDYGMGIRSQSGSSPRITNCDIHNNDMGVDIYYSSSSGNFISYNTIRDNTIQYTII